MENNDETKPLEEVQTEVVVDSEDEVKKKKKKSEKLIFLVGLTAIIFMIATYAWFIGTSNVVVNPFKIKISSSEGLTISLDAIHFGSSVDVSEEIVMGTATIADYEAQSLSDLYPNHKNHWVNSDSEIDENAPEAGLVPISSIGEMDSEYSVLKLFSKSSITSISGGYRLVSSRIKNYENVTCEEEDEDCVPGNVPSEKDGYVVFDLFIKNSSGTTYSKNYDSGADEAIYMIKGSYTKLLTFDQTAADSGDVAFTPKGGVGLENSARIAFMQIGRTDASNVSAEEGQNAQRLTCTSEDSAETPGDLGLCGRTDANMGERTDGRGFTWNIWEPNDSKHTNDSISHFERICQKRVGTNQYAGICTPIKGDSDITYDSVADYVPTYAVSEQINANDNVNIYDGLNDYAKVSDPEYKIKLGGYFTDTIKNRVFAVSTNEDYREPIFYLAPNSVTKIRVYVWLEGQDVDNYDIESTNMGLEIFFGFTKDQYEDVDLSKSYTVTIGNDGTGSGSVNGETVLPHDFPDFTYGAKQEFIATAQEGSRFVGWSDGIKDNPRMLSVTQDTEINAIFIPSGSYYVTAVSNNTEWGTVTGGGESSGSEITLTATPVSDKFTFLKWNDGNTDATRSFTPTSDAVLTAIFEAEKIGIVAGVATGQSGFGTVDIDNVVSPSEIFTTSDATYTGREVNYNSTHVVKAKPNSGYRFDCWHDTTQTCVDYHNPRVLAGVKEDKLMWAHFIKLININIDVDTLADGALNGETHGNVSGTSSNNINAGFASQKSSVMKVDEDASITLTATADNGYHFKYWKVEDDTTTYVTSPQLFETLTDNMNIVAVFEANDEPEPEP